MPRPLTSLTTPKLLTKLTLLNAKHRVTRKAVEAALGVSKATLSAYINGSPTKAPDRMPPDRLAKLVTLLQTCNSALNAEQAKAAWLTSDLKEFEQALQAHSSDSFADLLQAPHQQLAITPIPLQRNQLGMLADDDLALPTHHATRIILPSNQGLRFDIETQPGLTLFAACESAIGWHQVLPGTRHPGLSTTRRERVPQPHRPALSFKPPFGSHRFIFIEADLPSPLGRPTPAALTTPLTSAEIAALAHSLQQQAKSWRWGEVLVIVQDESATA